MSPFPTQLQPYLEPDAEDIGRKHTELRNMEHWLERNRRKLFSDRHADGRDYIAITAFPPKAIHTFKHKNELLEFCDQFPLSAYIHRHREDEMYML